MIDKNSLIERLELRVINDEIDILYRPIHTYLEFVKNDKTGKNRVKELALMSRDDFKEYLKTKFCFPNITEQKLIQLTSNDNHEEKWWIGAWKSHTDKLLKELDIKNPEEKTIMGYEIIKQ